jgi:hypothetical protein
MSQTVCRLVVAGIYAGIDACWSVWSLQSQLAIWFQLANVRVTSSNM